MRYLALLALFVACSPTARNQASPIKDQLLAKDRKPIVIAPIKIDVTAMASDTSVLHKSLAFRATDWQQRLPSFRLKVKAVGDPAQEGAPELNDEHTWRQAESGHWHVRHIAKGNAVDWMNHTGKLLVKNGKGDWRMRPMRIEFVDAEPNHVVDTLRDVFALAKDRVTLTQAGDGLREGRKVLKFKVNTVKAPSEADAPTSATTMTGELAVDVETGLVLSADLTTQVRLAPITPAPPRPVVLENNFPPSPPSKATTLALKLSWTVELPKNGESFEPTLPKFIDEVVRPRPVANPLAFWQTGKSDDKAGKDQDDDEP